MIPSINDFNNNLFRPICVARNALAIDSNLYPPGALSTLSQEAIMIIVCWIEVTSSVFLEGLKRQGVFIVLSHTIKPI